MNRFPYRENELASQVIAFAATLEPARDRWMYCLDRATFEHTSEKFGTTTHLNFRTLPVCDRILGVVKGGAKSGFWRISAYGWEAALEKAAERNRQYPTLLSGNWHKVGPLQAWNFGHVYFARVETHPHVLKVGFSRRVKARLEDVEARWKTKLVLEPDALKVGTLADEHWWHKHWERTHISGEWFFDPSTTDRSLPEFLREAEAA